MCDLYNHDYSPLGCAVCGREICWSCSGDYRQGSDGEAIAVCSTCRMTRPAEVDQAGCVSWPVSSFPDDASRLVAGLTAGA